jgi:ribosomal protein L40E/cytochrome c-type biogenesis protein CcmH/NrfF
MKCNQCGADNPKRSKFCRKCGTSFEIHFQCPQCGFENPGESSFCIECGEKLFGGMKSMKGNQRKCRSCGQFNPLDALFCVACGEEISRPSKEGPKKPSTGPSYKTIALVIGFVFFFGLLVKLGTAFFKPGKTSSRSSSLAPVSKSAINVDEAQVIAVAKNFKCPCGGCGEDALETCTCDMPKGAVETKNFIREKLAEGLTVEQVIELVDKKYGHRVKV